MTDRTREIAERASERWWREREELGMPTRRQSITVTELADAIAAAIREAGQARWVPVSERLPEEGENALVTHGDDITIGWIDWADSAGAMWWTTDGPDEDGPTHWQPLPSPPEEESP
jgi:hypothetical protein